MLMMLAAGVGRVERHAAHAHDAGCWRVQG